MQTHKICSRCGQDKPASDYTTRKGAKGKVWLQSRCKQCASEAARVHQRNKFATKEAYNEHMVNYRRTPNGALSWFRSKAKRLGLPPEEVDKAVAAFMSGKGQCEVCGNDPVAQGNKNGLAIDHCHETLTFRGLLCTQCNTMLGYAKDRPDVLRAGADYLEAHRR